MIAAGLDIGGTKIVTQLFDGNWQPASHRRVPTPAQYDELIACIADEIARACENDSGIPVGVGMAGLINPQTGLALTANLPATGRPLLADICTAAGRQVHLLNDCRAHTVSEAQFGAARGELCVVGLFLGTGVGGGIAIGGRLMQSPNALSGEFGHTAAPADIVAAHGLPIVTCGCGRIGCIETLIAGAGLTRLGECFIGETLSPEAIVERRNSDAAAEKTWETWCLLVGELVLSTVVAVDPDMVVLGGGLSGIDGVVEGVDRAVRSRQLPGFRTPRLAVADGEADSAARGAAYHAWSVQHHA